MKKLTFLMLHLNYGGLEKQTITLVNELAKTEKYDITIISVYDMLHGKSFYDIDSRVKVEFLSNFGPHHKEFYDSMKHFNIPKFVKEAIVMIKCGIYKSKVLKKKIKELDTDVIISSRIEFSKLIDRRDTLNISQEHSYVTTSKYIGRVKKWFKNIDSIVVMTKKAKEDYEKWLVDSNSQAKVYNISNMIEKVVDGVNANYDNNTIISVGRLEKVKDFPTLLEVFKKVHDSHEELELKIVGEGSQRETLERRIKELNLEGSVTITGRIPTDMVKRELEKAKIFVLTSVCESFSLVLCEAMEQGLPSLSFDIDVGPKEIIKDGYNGFLIENRNVDKMAQKIIELVENRELWNNISKNALEDVSKYYSENVAQGWISILDRK